MALPTCTTAVTCCLGEVAAEPGPRCPPHARLSAAAREAGLRAAGERAPRGGGARLAVGCAAAALLLRTAGKGGPAPWAAGFTLAALSAPLLVALLRRLGCTAGERCRAPPWPEPRSGDARPQPARGKSEGEEEVQEDHLRWCFMPSTGVLRANMARALPSESSMASLKFLVLHRPTHEPERDAVGDYPYSWHLRGRKRLWEVRVQVRFKRKPTGQVFFGIEMRPGPQSSSALVKRIQGLLLRAVRRTIGEESYQTPGDDPATTVGEVEPPTFTMPLWALDQFHVAEPGEEPDLTGDLVGWGQRRTDGLKAYVAAVRAMLETLSCDKVYTFCFWGISQFIDVVNWEFTGMGFGFRMDANRLCGSPPVFVVAYELDSSACPCAAAESEARSLPRRHLLSQRLYYFKVALWSTLRPPDPASMRDLLGAGAAEAGGHHNSIVEEPPRKARRGMRPWFGCLAPAVRQPQTAAARAGRPLKRWAAAGRRLLGSCMGGL